MNPYPNSTPVPSGWVGIGGDPSEEMPDDLQALININAKKEAIAEKTGSPGPSVPPQPVAAALTQTVASGGRPFNPYLSLAQDTAQRKSDVESKIFNLTDALQNGSLAPVQDAKKAVADQENAINDYKNIDKGINLPALAAIVDQVTGSKLTPAAKELYDAPSEKAQQMLALQDQLTKRKGELSKNQLDAVKDQLTALVGVDTANKINSGGLANGMQERTDRAAYNRLVAQTKNDKTLTQELSGLNTISNSLNEIGSTDALTPQQVAHFQQSMRNIITRGTSGIHERAGTYYDTAGNRLDALSQFITGDPSNLAKDSPQLIHLKQLALNEAGNLRDQYNNRLKVASAGYDDILEAHPEWKKSFNGLMGNMQGAVQPSPVMNRLQKEVNAKSPGAAYHNLSEAELDALIAKRRAQQ